MAKIILCGSTKLMATIHYRMMILLWSLKKKLMSKGINRLSDITEWDVNGNWTTWSLPSLIDRNLANCSVHKKFLFEKLIGLAPIHRDYKDMWGWGINGSYSTAIGFKQMYSSQPGSPDTHNAAVWKMVWNMPSVPKLNFFIWTTQVLLLPTI